jgi:hypothetical protein
MKEPNVKIVLLPVEDYDRRKVAEAYENAVFETHEDARKVFGEEAGISDMSTFMDMCNDQEINLEGYWITYITITEE